MASVLDALSKPQLTLVEQYTNGEPQQADPACVRALARLEHCPPQAMPMLPTRPNRLRECAALSAAIGLGNLMPHQVLVLAGATEMCCWDSACQRLRWPDICVTTPRQNGKSSIFMLLVLDRILLRYSQNVLWSAQKLTRAISYWRKDPIQLMEASGVAQHAGARLVEAVGDPKLRVSTTKSIMQIVSTNSHIDGHGETANLVVVDEAMSLVDDRVDQSLRPTLRTKMASGGQFAISSTAGDMSSNYLRGYVNRGRSAHEKNDWGSLGYWEWSAAEDLPYDDPATWRAATPALGYTIDEETIRGECERTDENEFRRFGLNQWVEIKARTAVSLAQWREVELKRVVKGAKPDGGIWLGVDASPDRERASIVACDSMGRAELVKQSNGVMWVAQYVSEICEKQSDVVGVAFLTSGPVSFLADELNVHHYGSDVVLMPTGDAARASNKLYDGVEGQGILVIPSRGAFERAIQGSRQMKAGDTWRIARRDESTDASALVALSLAYYQATKLPDTSKDFGFTL